MIEQKPTQSGDQQPVLEIDPMRLEYAITTMRSEQNLPMGLAGGSAAAVLGAILWAVVTVTTGYQIGFMAIGVGVLVGFSIRKLGKGMDKSFGFSGAVLSLFGCALGNLLAVCAIIASQEGIPIMQVLSAINFQNGTELMAGTFTPMDLLFYGIAVYEGYKLSFRQVTKADLARVLPEVNTASTAP